MRGTAQTMAPGWIGLGGVDVANSRCRGGWMVVGIILLESDIWAIHE